MPTQTYNPDPSSFHTSSQYQENGDVSDAAVLQLTGEDALDNVAYLTGSASRSQVAQLWTVADLAALKAVGASDRRDQDYAVLDSNKRMYQFDSGSSATGDDYAVVQPTAGTGRWILQSSAVPENTAHRWVLTGFDMTFDANAVYTPASGYVRIANTGNTTGQGQFTDFNAGDVISEIQLVGYSDAGAGSQIDATFYLIQSDDGDTSPTVTNLGTVSIAANAGNAEASSTAAPLPITMPGGSSHDAIIVTVSATGGAPTIDRLHWLALNGTRSYVRE